MLCTYCYQLCSNLHYRNYHNKDWEVEFKTLFVWGLRVSTLPERYCGQALPWQPLSLRIGNEAALRCTLRFFHSYLSAFDLAMKSRALAVWRVIIRTKITSFFSGTSSFRRGLLSLTQWTLSNTCSHACHDHDSLSMPVTFIWRLSVGLYRLYIKTHINMFLIACQVQLNIYFIIFQNMIYYYYYY